MVKDQTIVVCCNGKDAYSAHRTISGEGETEEKSVADLVRREKESHRQFEKAKP